MDGMGDDRYKKRQHKTLQTELTSAAAAAVAVAVDV